jgi:hypothetical protein
MLGRDGAPLYQEATPRVTAALSDTPLVAHLACPLLRPAVTQDPPAKAQPSRADSAIGKIAVA